MINIFSLILVLFLSIAVIFPSGFSNFKIIILALLTIKTLYDFYSNRIKVHKNIVLFLSLFIGYLGISLFYSVIKGYGINFRIVSEYLFLPIIYPLVSYQVSNLIPLNKRINIIYLLSLGCIFFNLLNFLYQLDFVSFPLLTFMQGTVRVEDGQLLSRLPNQVPLIFISPIVILTNPLNKFQRNLKPYLVFLLIIVAFFSGRRALQFSVISSIIFYLFNFRFLIRDLFKLKVYLPDLKKSLNLQNLLLIFFSFSILFIINREFQIYSLFNSFFETISVIFDNSDRTVLVRNLQGQKLIEEGLNKLLFGHGATANLVDFIRSEAGKWSYELRYHALFFQVGLFGIILYLITFIWVIKINLLANFKYLSKDNYYLGIGTAFLIFIFSAYSNPFYMHPFPWLISIATYYDNYLKKI